MVPPNIPDEMMTHSTKRPNDGPDAEGSKAKARQMPRSVSPQCKPNNHLKGDVPSSVSPSQPSQPLPKPKAKLKAQPQQQPTTPSHGTKRKSEPSAGEEYELVAASPVETKKNKKVDDGDDDELIPDPDAAPSGENEPYSGPPILPMEDGEQEAQEDQPIGSSPSDETIQYEDDDSDDTLDYNDLTIDESQWTYLTEEQKLCCNTGSFTVPKYIDGSPVDLSNVGSSSSLSMSYSVLTERQKNRCRKIRSDIIEEYKNISDDDKSYFTLYHVNQHFSNLFGKKRKEASQQEKRELAKQFLEAKKAECKSWLDNEMFDLVDMRKMKVRNFVAGRWVPTTKRDKDGNFVKCKARWLLKGFQDKQKNDQQIDDPAASRSGFKCAVQLAANKGWNLFHMDLKTAFLQGESYDETRDALCQIPAK